MTIDDLKTTYGIPRKVIEEYYSEFLVNTPDTDEFKTAADKWGTATTAGWSWQSGAENSDVTWSLTAFSPPAAFVTNQQQRGGWNLQYLNIGGSVYYGALFNGYIDYRLGHFNVNIYPLRVREENNGMFQKYYYQCHIDASVGANPFAGLSSLVVQYENGFAIDYDYQRIKAALAYITAKQKFSTEISVAADLARQKAQSSISAFSMDISDRLRSEASDLSQKKFAIMIAISNEEKSASRDMQNLLLNAQNLSLK